MCHGLAVAREQNPLRFEVAHMYTGYERQAAKVLQQPSSPPPLPPHADDGPARSPSSPPRLRLELRTAGETRHPTPAQSPPAPRSQRLVAVAHEIARAECRSHRSPPRAPQMALLRGRNLALSTSLLRVKYMLPCTQSAVAALGCDPKEKSKCLPCPDIRAYAGVECCVEAPRDGSAMDGATLQHS